MTSIWANVPINHNHSYFEKFKFFRNANDFNNCYTVYLLEKGSFKYKIGGDFWQELGENQAVICPPNVNFSKVVITPVTMHILYLSFKTEINLLPQKINYSSSVRISDNLDKLRSLLCQADIPIENYKNHLINDVWYDLLSLIENPFAEYKSKIADNLFLEMANFISDNLDTSLDGVAKAFNCSRVAVNLRFKRNTGKSVGSYIQEVRIKKACKLIKETDYPLKYIAPACGFSNEYYFSSVFKKYTGETPANYRKQN